MKLMTPSPSVAITASPMLRRTVESHCSLSQLGLHRKLVEARLDGGLQLTLVERFQDIPERPCANGFIEGPLFCIGGQVDHRDVETMVDLFRSLDPAHLILEHDVHQDQRGAKLVRLVNGIFPGRYRGGHRIAQPFQHIPDVECHDGFVFHDEDACRAHFIRNLRPH